MTGLGDALGRSHTLERPALPDLDRLRSSVSGVLARWPGVALPPEQDRERQICEFRDREREGQWTGLFVSDVTAAARVLYTPAYRDRSDLARLRRFFPAEIEVSTRRAFLGGMASVYIDTYEPGATHSIELGRALGAARHRLGDRWKGLLRWIPNLFDPGRAHYDLAAQMINMGDPWRELKRIGLQPIGSGLMDAAHLAYVAALAPRLDERSQFERLVKWLKPEAPKSPRVSGAGAAIDAALAPWINRAPDQDHLTHLMTTIRDLYGHPRLGNQAVWSEVGEAAKAVLSRWLTGASIRVFLDVVSEVESSPMWKPRRKFWLDLYERKWIKDAWAAFCADGEQVARRHEARGVITAERWHGRQTAGGARRDTSLLILELERCIVVEGSHSYKVHVFGKNHPKAPRLYQDRYDCEAIRLLPHVAAIPHHHGWEDRVRDAVRTYT